MRVHKLICTSPQICAQVEQKTRNEQQVQWATSAIKSMSPPEKYFSVNRLVHFIFCRFGRPFHCFSFFRYSTTVFARTGFFPLSIRTNDFSSCCSPSLCVCRCAGAWPGPGRASAIFEQKNNLFFLEVCQNLKLVKKHRPKKMSKHKVVEEINWQNK